MEAGLRGYVGGDYSAVLLGFTYHQEMEGSFAVQKPTQEANEVEPADAEEP